MFFRVIAIFIIAFQTIIFDNLDKYIQRNMNGNSSRIKYKIVMLGDQGVGKTALIDRYIHNIFNPSYNVLTSSSRLP